MKLNKGFRLASWSAFVAAVLSLPLVSGPGPQAQAMPTLNPPVANPPGQSFTALSPGITVVLTVATPGAYILYTTDGTEPDSLEGSRSKKYTGPIAVIQTTVLKAISRKPGFASSKVITEIYSRVAPPKVAMPTANPPAGNIVDSVLLVLSTSTPGASIYYTLNGSTPDILGTALKYSGPIVLRSTATLKAVALREGSLPSDVLTAIYVFPSTSVRVPGKRFVFGNRVGETLRTWSGRRLDGAKL